MWGKLFGDLIIKGTYKYDYVISRRPDLKGEIDAYLISVGRGDLITQPTEPTQP